MRQNAFSSWGKVWALGFPPKFMLFIWKVVHGILAVKDVLRRRSMDIDLECPLCKTEVETLEHLFLK